MAFGLSSVLAGELSDGLVRIDNAAVDEAPRAFVHRSHSGYFGIVNSEEGYQSLTRFLFGDVRVDGVLEVESVPLPPEVQKAVDKKQTVKASYFFEVAVAPRGAFTYDLTRRTRANGSAILRTFDELMKPAAAGLSSPRHPYLFSVFLDSSRIEKGNSLVFSIDLAVSSTGYEVDDRLLLSSHIPGEYLFRNTLVISATPGVEGKPWSIQYVWSDDKWASGKKVAAEATDDVFAVPVPTMPLRTCFDCSTIWSASPPSSSRALSGRRSSPVSSTTRRVP